MDKSVSSEKKLFVADPHGFCNGVKRALKIVEDLLEQGAVDIYIYNDIVHNSFVVNGLKERGVKFVTTLDEPAPGSHIVWSAHGVSPELEALARSRALQITDATCPLVSRVHELAKQYLQAGARVIFAGHAGHPETEGVLGCGNIDLVGREEDCEKLPELSDRKKTVMLTQTTWCQEDVEKIIRALQKRFPDIEYISNICYATSERQQAVRTLIGQHKVEYLVVIGSAHSSNARRLCEVAQSCGSRGILINDPGEIRQLDLTEVARIGITAGASTPEILLEKAIKILNDMGFENA